MQTKPQEYENTSHERLAEIGLLLSQAILRLKAANTSKNRDFSLDFYATPSIHRDTLTTTEKDYE